MLYEVITEPDEQCCDNTSSNGSEKQGYFAFSGNYKANHNTRKDSMSECVTDKRHAPEHDVGADKPAAYPDSNRCNQRPLNELVLKRLQYVIRYYVHS